MTNLHISTYTEVFHAIFNINANALKLWEISSKFARNVLTTLGTERKVYFSQELKRIM